MDAKDTLDIARARKERNDYRKIKQYAVIAIGDEIIVGCAHEGCDWERGIKDEISIASLMGVARNHDKEEHRTS